MQIRGGKFAYTVIGTSIKFTTTNHFVAKTVFKKAVLFLPLSNTVPIQHLRAPYYIYAIGSPFRWTLFCYRECNETLV